MKVNSLVMVEGYGKGVIKGFSGDKEYPIFIEFLANDLHESESSGCFNKKQIKEV